METIMRTLITVASLTVAVSVQALMVGAVFTAF